MSDQPNVPSNIGTFIRNVLSVVKEQVNGKQDVVKGLPGQVVGFDADGNMQAQDFDGGGGGPITSGVSSFNGRTGAVQPKEGDYTAEMVGAEPAGSSQNATDELRTEVEGKFTEQDEKLTTGLQGVNDRVDTVEQGLDDKISSSGGTMQAALVFAQSSVARSVGDSGSIVMKDDALTITSATGIVRLVDEADGKNAVLSGVDFAVKSNEAVPLQQMEEALAAKGDALDYDGLNLSLKSGEKTLSTVEIAGGGGGTAYRFGHGLKQTGLDVSVDAVSDFSGDNTLPMTAAGVQASVGNIEALLATI